jgi:hypothetical protein
MRLKILAIVFFITSCNFQKEEVEPIISLPESSDNSLTKSEIDSNKINNEILNADEMEIYHHYICDYKDFIIDTTNNNFNYNISYKCTSDSLVLSESTYTEVSSGKKFQDYYHNYIISIQSVNFTKEVTIEKENFSSHIDNEDFMKKSTLGPPVIERIKENTLVLNSFIGHPGTDYFIKATYKLDEFGNFEIITID